MSMHNKDEEMMECGVWKNNLLYDMVGFYKREADMECWYVLWCKGQWQPPYLVLGQWDNGNIGIIYITDTFCIGCNIASIVG